ncbi:MAG: ROK family protein [Acidimicrobiia bacterium]|nr:ROK family protein [Actinomycetota bacterium]NDE58633.1 ROK family protein [Acidimicrobiia bacterium]NDF31354.1 ROK family protein [Acidimicrobiia bacterium]NDH47173.1 ROK family protein [Acidimicrobiia bacterium]
MTSEIMTSEPDASDIAAPRELALAIDIGGTKMAVGLVSRKGEMLDRDVIRTDRDKNANDLFESLSVIVRRQAERASERHGGKVVVCGVGSAGPIEPDCTTVSPLNIPAWRRFPLREALSTVVGVPVYGDLDAKAFALAEGWLGAAKGSNNYVGMVVSTGVGGGIVVDGRMIDGASGNAGHIGHVIVNPDGHRCGCGARGCLEAEASGSAIEAITGRPATEPSYETMQRTGRMVGRAVASVCNFFDLRLAVVGGSVALGFGPTFFQSAQEVIDEHCRLAFSRGARIVPARLGDRSPIIGAGAVGWRGLNRS